MSTQDWVWRAPPGWPQPPPGWAPPAGWRPSPDWPPPPADWVYWVPATTQPPREQPQQPAGRAAEPPAQPSAPVRIEEPSRRGLVLETWFVQIAFLVPGVISAVDVLAAHVGGAGAITRFPIIIPGHPLANLILGIVTYFQVAAVVPLALLLLSRTGQTPAVLGLTRPGWARDVWPGLGLAAAGYGVVVLVAIAFTPLLDGHKGLFNQVPVGHVPKYYVIYGIAVAAVTSVTEETLVSGYLLTRLDQLGWNPRWALVLSLTLRTSYHVYYGLGFLLTIPVGYFLTRSFQKHRRLMRPIIGHFLYDAVLITISVLAS
jgi:membrane protease YdiL (CAAX protease family)